MSVSSRRRFVSAAVRGAAGLGSVVALAACAERAAPVRVAPPTPTPPPTPPTATEAPLRATPAATPTAAPTATPTPAPDAWLAGLDETVQQIMRAWNVPGVAVGVLRDGAVVYRQGFGYRDQARGLKVTPQTLFAIGSCTKAFTTLGLSTLVDARRLDWDTPVRTYLPSFKMLDPFASERMTARDLVLHRSGLPEYEEVWYGSAASRVDLMGRLQYLQPSRDFRSVFQYQNLMYMAAGYLAGTLSGQSWEDLTRKRILEPLQMTATNLSVTTMQQAADHATPYMQWLEGDGVVVKAVPPRNVDAIGPAGAINSNVDDMLQWLRFQLSQGELNGVHIVSSNQQHELHAAQMIEPSDYQFPELPGPLGYALGWEVLSYRGSRLVRHSGAIDGFFATTAFMPDANLGVVVLTNMNPILTVMGPSEAVVYNVLDRALGLNQIDWSTRFQGPADDEVNLLRGYTAAFMSTRHADAPPSLALDRYAGKYTNPGYDALTVALKDGQLTASFNTFTCSLLHHDHDAFGLNWVEKSAIFPVQFVIGKGGTVDQVAVVFNGAIPPTVYTRA